MSALVVSEARVPVADLQQVTGPDLTAAGALAQVSTDNVVLNCLIAGSGYTGMAATVGTSATAVNVAPGWLLKGGPAYALRDAFALDLSAAIASVPDASKTLKVLILADGQEFDSQEVRTFLDPSKKPTNPADPWPTVTYATPTRKIRSVVVSKVAGTADVQPQAPAFNAILCLIATVVVSNTGIVSITQNTAQQITRLDQIVPLVAAMGVQLATLQSSTAGLLSSVSALAMALTQLRKDTAAALAALAAQLNAQAAQQASAQQPGTTAITIVDTFTDATGLTVTANPGYAVGSGLTFPQLVTNPISFFPLAQYAGNLKVLGGRYLTAPYTEVKDGGSAVDFPHNDGGVYVYAKNLGPLAVTPLQEGFAVQRTRYGAAYGAQSYAALLASGNPSQLFGSASYPLVYDPSWTNWANFSPELNHANGLWRDLSARGLWGPRLAGAAIGNLPAVSEVFQANTDDMTTEIRFFHASSPSSMRLLICDELNGAPDFANVLVDVMGAQDPSYADMVFTLPYPFLRKAGRRYHYVFVFTDPATVFVTTPDSYASKLDPSMKGLLYRTANGGWVQDSNNQHITCTYKRDELVSFQ